MAAILEIKTGAEADWHALQTAGYQRLVFRGLVATSRPGHGCWYDPLTHTYEIDRHPVISVTQVLTHAGRIDATWFTDDSRRRGTLVHDATRIVDSIVMNPPALDETLGGFVEAYVAFKADLRPRFRYIETPFWHAGERFAGRPDRVLTSFDSIVQHGRFLLYLRANGHYRLTRCRRAEDHVDFTTDLANARDAISSGSAV